MYKPFLYCFIILLETFNSLHAQNLIYNGDFELYDTCPSSMSSPSDLQIERCLGWYSPTLGTSDYYNSCATSMVSIPNNAVGYQVPLSGNAYLGLIPLYNVANDFGFWSEYVQSKLVTPLIANRKYHVSFFINVANYSNDYSIKNFGAHFSVQPISKTDFKPFTTIIPQIAYSGNNFIIDTINWIEISGEFIANGGEEYITIGTFVDTLNFDTLCNYTDFPCDFTQFVTYYLIDNCELIEVENEVLIPNIFTPNKDGQNDLFSLNFKFELIQIYNRWGQKMFESDTGFWDGRSSTGQNVPDGTYFYIITTENKTYKGYIQLLR